MSNARLSLVVALLAMPLLMGGACEKKKPNDTGAVSAMDRAEDEKGPVDTTPLPGVTVDKLSGDRLQLFYKLIGSLKSPCGKSHSLRTSFTQDTSCKRAPYAVKYVYRLLVDELPEAKAREYYALKYESTAKPVSFDLAKAPYLGKNDAPIRLVEFYDYACPACQALKPELEKVAAQHQGSVVQYFMMYPIEHAHPDSRSAAQAALAAWKLGGAEKFDEMHQKLFARSPQHNKTFVTTYATELGLDGAKFAEAYAAANAQVNSDMAQGQGNGVEGTPTLFFNDRRYQGPMGSEYIGMWIEEELAVNR